MTTKRIVFNGLRFFPQYKGEYTTWLYYEPEEIFLDTPSFATLEEAREYILQQEIPMQVVWEGS